MLGFSSWTKQFVRFRYFCNKQDIRSYQTKRRLELFPDLYGKDLNLLTMNQSIPLKYRRIIFLSSYAGIGGGIDANGMRLFDVAIRQNDLKDIDIWKEAGTTSHLRK